jgi:hypothetical protein
MIINNYIPTHPVKDRLSGSNPDLVDSLSSQLCSLRIPKLWDDAVKACCKWHCLKVRCPIQKQHYKLAYDLTLERGFNIELVYKDNDAQFYIERGVLEGVTRRWVRDVKAFLDEYDTL